MARWDYPINAFNAGEFSPHLAGRFDLDKYASSVETMLNFIIQPQGGAKKRSGTRYVKPLQNSAATARLIPFTHSSGGVTNAYILEFGLNYIKFYRNEAPVLEATKNILSITQANPAVVEVTGHGYSNGNEVKLEGISSMAELNNRYFTVANVTANTFELQGENSTLYTAYAVPGTAARVYTVTTTYTQAEIEDVEFAQSSDTLFLSHQAHKPAQLTRTGHTAWTLADVAFVDGPYLSENNTDNTLVNTAKTGAITVDAINTKHINNGVGFGAPLDIGRLIRIRHFETPDTDVGHMSISSVNSTISVNGTVIHKFKTDLVTSYGWRLGAFYPGNYPRAVSFGDGRLWWGGTPSDPNTVWGSMSGDFLNYAPSTWKDDVIADDNAVSYTVGVNQVSSILWLMAARGLMLGTPGGIFPLGASVNSEPITPTNVNVPRPVQVRASSSHPAVVGDSVVYITRNRDQLRVIRYQLASDGFSAENLMRAADHIGKSKLMHVSYQQDPDSILWCGREDGSFATLTYLPDEDIVAWSRQILGGNFSGGDPVVEKSACVESPNTDHDQVWMIVKRTINGNTVRYVEFLEEEFSETGDVEDAFNVDCGFSYNDVATTTITGLRHLEGETVDILADGAPVPQALVSNGQITLATAAAKVHVGYAYNSDLYTNRINAPSPDGTSQGKINRVNAVIIRLHRSIGGKYGPDANSLSPIIYRDPFDTTDSPVPLFTGDRKLAMELKRDRDPRLFIRADQPMPFNILSMTQLGTGGDR